MTIPLPHSMLKFFIENQTIKPELEYILKTWGRSLGVPLEISHSPLNAIVLPVDNSSRTEQWTVDGLSKLFCKNDAKLMSPRDQTEYLQTSFYLINSVQEYRTTDLDDLGRFKFINSYQFRLQNASENIVQQYFDKIAENLKVIGVKRKSRFFLTHDIDLVYNAILEDGFSAIKKGRFDKFLGMLFRLAMGRPDWLNMDKIMALETAYDCKSVFYWIVNKGVINKRERNADYSFSSPALQDQFKTVQSAGFESGIHKSISGESFKEEIEKFGRMPFGNRYHYLKFSLPQAYHDIECANLKIDASVGFAEKSGFRNSYGLPFNPFDFANRRPFNFVEVPLHIMDRTFFQYQKVSPEVAGEQIINFFEKNKENCVISVLWHNNFFTHYKFKGYLNLYKKILAYIRDNGAQTVSQKEIFEEYSITHGWK
jgi:hypothetical protein